MGENLEDHGGDLMDVLFQHLAEGIKDNHENP
jgi:hypothetical protein